MRRERALPARVDFIGPHGVGKTTLARALVRSQLWSGRSWISHEEARLAIAAHIAWEAGKYDQTPRIALFKIPRIGAALADRYLRLPTSVALSERTASWGSGFIEACIDSILSPSRGESLRCLEGFRILRELLGAVALLEKYAQSRAVLMDESLSQFVGLLLANADGEPALINRLMSFPAPTAVIHVSGPEDEIVGRLMARDSNSYAGLKDAIRFEDELLASTRRSLRRCEAVREALDEKGVPVLSLNGLDPRTDQVTSAQVFLKTVFGHP